MTELPPMTRTLTMDVENSPSIRSVLPHLLGGSSVWTTELELELLEFAELCEDYAVECEKAALHKHRANMAFRIISMFCAGSAAIVPHFQSISALVASYVVTGVSTVSLGAGVVQSVCNFEKSAGAERSASIQLREISKEARIEISKPISLRWADPYAKLMGLEEKYSEIVRSISPKVVGSDIKSKIKSARRARMKSKTPGYKAPLT